MQKYTILIGMNGAGLTNGLYLPPGGVVVQLVPNNSKYNNREFGELLQGGGGGGYLEWINPYDDRTVNDAGDTIIDVEAIGHLVHKAVKLFEETEPRYITDEL